MPVATVLGSKHYRTLPSAQRVPRDSTALAWNSKDNRAWPAPALLLSSQVGAPLDRWPREMGKALWGDWNCAIHFRDQTDLSNGSSWQLKPHGWVHSSWGWPPVGSIKVCMHICVCVCVRVCVCMCTCPWSHTFLCVWLYVFREGWRSNSALNDSQRLISEDCIPHHISGMFLTLSRKGDALVLTVCNLLLLH